MPRKKEKRIISPLRKGDTVRDSRCELDLRQDYGVVRRIRRVAGQRQAEVEWGQPKPESTAWYALNSRGVWESVKEKGAWIEVVLHAKPPNICDGPCFLIAPQMRPFSWSEFAFFDTMF